MGEDQALPQAPGLPRRGRFSTYASPCQISMGEGEQWSGGGLGPPPDQFLLLSHCHLTGGGIRWEAAAPRQTGGPGEGLALPRAGFSPSSIAMGEGAGG